MIVKETVVKEIYKTAVGYVRVSSEGQAKDDRYGLEAQREAIMKYANQNGYQISYWVEDHESGTNYDREVWCNQILYSEEVRSPEVDAVIVFKNDRIARGNDGMKMYFYYLYILEKRGVKLLSTVEDFESQNDFANIYRALMSFVAEQERKNILIRTSNGRLAKASHGGYSGGKAPYGYFVQNKQLVIDENEAKIVEIIFNLRDSGMGLHSICEYLNRNDYKPRTGEEFYKTTVKNIIENRLFYAGYYSYGDVLYEEGVHQPILKRSEAMEREVRYKKMEDREKKEGISKEKTDVI